MLEPADDLRHELRPEPFARESLFYSLLLPDEGLMLVVYTWVDGSSRAGHLVTLVSGDDVRHAYSVVDGVDVGDANFDDWQVEGLHVGHRELMQVAELSFRDADLHFELEFSAMHAPFSYTANEGGCPTFLADDRFEQAGFVRGTVTVGGREIAVDTTGHRDHSWGVRDWDAMQDWKWISGQAQDGTAFNVLRVHARGADHVNGYVSRNGVVTPVVDIRAEARYDDRWWQTHGDVTVVGTDGRTTRIEIERYALFPFEAGERIVLHEAACTGTVDGVPATVHFECGWDKHYAALQTGRAATAGESP